MAEDGVEPNKITFTALITACAKAAGAGVGAFALDRGMMLLERMQELGLETGTHSQKSSFERAHILQKSSLRGHTFSKVLVGGVETGAHSQKTSLQ